MINWLKMHKLIVILVIVIAVLLYRNVSSGVTSLPYRMDGGQMSLSTNQKAIGGGVPNTMMYPESAPNISVTDRLVVRNSYLSLVVVNVVEAQKKILETTKNLGGYMVSSTITNPEDVATATVVVRVPANKLDTAIDAFRKTGVKVVSESLDGYDVTDEYVDIQSRMDTLLKTKVKFEEILNRAVAVADVLEVQRELINLQSQIDSLKGQEQYLVKNAEVARITVSLSTDEFSLPYAPSEAWRPEVIFKQAVRSLVASLRQLGTVLIWILVFSIIWIPALVVFLFIRKRLIRSSSR